MVNHNISTDLSTDLSSYAQDYVSYSQDTHGSSHGVLASRVTRPRKLARASTSIVPSVKQCADCQESFSGDIRAIRCEPCKETHGEKRKKEKAARNYTKHREQRIAKQKERMTRLEALGVAKEVKRKYRKAQRLRYVSAGLTIKGTERKVNLEETKEKKFKLRLRKWRREWLSSSAPDPCVAAWYRATDKPWNNPRITAGEKFRVRYECDHVFRAREILKTQVRKKARARRIESQSDGTLTAQSLGALFADAKFCAYCMESFENSREKTLDHVEPLYLGGQHSLDNAVIACVSCNSSKGKKSLVRWLIAAQQKLN
jgi:5-methylcytosine-specific restriction endonuclease McrA